MRARQILTAILSLILIGVPVTPAPAVDPPGAAGPVPKAPAEALAAGDVGRRAAAVYDRAARAMVRVEGEQGKFNGGEAGVIVTAEGHVLYRPIPGGGKRAFRLAEGRRATGVHLGWSAEWGLGLAKLDGPGPWPHVELTDTAGVKAGLPIVTLGYPDSEPRDLLPGPLLGVGWVTRAAPGRWFVGSDGAVTRWRNAPAAFDFDGRLIGIGWVRDIDGGGTIYTDTKVVRALWADLVAGKNLDEVRLRGDRKGGTEPAPAAPGKAVTEVATAKAKAASVVIRVNPKERGWSGTIVTADGVVATCAHSFASLYGTLMPGAKVIVGLPDGRDAAAVVVGYNLVSDVCEVKITDKGPWPHVEMGDSTRMRPGDPCLFIGYGPKGDRAREPEVRSATIAKPWSSHWDPRLDIDSGVPFVGGDSGGGVFDVDGRLVALHGLIGEKGKRPHRGMRVELFREHRGELGGAYEKAIASPFAAVETALLRTATGVRPGVVEVLDGKKVVALGTVVGRDGRVLTLASTLPDSPSCRLADGRVLPAKVMKTSREHDLAVLKVEADGLTVIDWSKDGDPGVGTPVTVAAAAKEMPLGFISHKPVAIPPEYGGLYVDVRDGTRGLEVAEVFDDSWPTPLRKGDVLLSYDGRPTPDRKTYLGLLTAGPGVPLAGDRVTVVVERGGKKVELRPALGPPSVPRPDGQSPRYSGYARAFGVAVDPKAVLLGGPVFDQDGRVLGVAVAWRAGGWLLVFPAATAKEWAGE